MPDLPLEVITEILLRLPVKTLSKFKCVSKPWRSLISSSQFIKEHLSFNKSMDNKSLLIVEFHYLSHGNHHLKHCSLNSLLSEQQPTDDAVEIDYPPFESPNKSIIVVGCYNGLFCIAIKEKGFFLWNPCTKKSKKLPNLDIGLKKNQYYLTCGFGYDENNDDYKVVVIICFLDDYSNPFGSEVKVYSIKTESWREIGEFQGGYPAEHHAVFVNGKLHWALNNADYDSIVSLDLVTETYGSLDLATEIHEELKKTNSGKFVLGTFEGSLCLSFRKSWELVADVWVVKEYGVRDSWTKVLNIPIKTMMCSFTPLCILGSSKLIMVLKGKLCDANDNSSRFLPSSLKTILASVYVESLVSPSFNDALERLQQQ